MGCVVTDLQELLVYVVLPMVVIVLGVVGLVVLGRIAGRRARRQWRATRAQLRAAGVRGLPEDTTPISVRRRRLRVGAS